MQVWFDNALLVWLIALVATLTLYALRARRTLAGAVALVSLGPVVTALLAVLAVRFGTADYLDIALVIAMLGVAETLTIARTTRARGGTGRQP